jgi:hypothetical protein
MTSSTMSIPSGTSTPSISALLCILRRPKSILRLRKLLMSRRALLLMTHLGSPVDQPQRMKEAQAPLEHTTHSWEQSFSNNWTKRMNLQRPSTTERRTRSRSKLSRSCRTSFQTYQKVDGPALSARTITSREDQHAIVVLKRGNAET